MEVRSCCLKVGWGDAITTTKPNHNFLIKKLQKNNEVFHGAMQ
jgi:hypothetical protein